jgi:hypothetical protein
VRALPILALVGLLAVAACRRENPAVRREATAAAGRAATAAAAPSPTATAALAVGATTPAAGAAPASAGRTAKISAGNLGVGNSGISAGIQVWSKPGGVLAGGSTMAGTVSDGATVDLLGEEQYLGQKYYQIKSGATQGWVDGRFIQTS